MYAQGGPPSVELWVCSGLVCIPGGDKLMLVGGWLGALLAAGTGLGDMTWEVLRLVTLLLAHRS